MYLCLRYECVPKSRRYFNTGRLHNVQKGGVVLYGRGRRAGRAAGGGAGGQRARARARGVGARGPARPTARGYSARGTVKKVHSKRSPLTYCVRVLHHTRAARAACWHVLVHIPDRVRHPRGVQRAKLVNLVRACALCAQLCLSRVDIVRLARVLVEADGDREVLWLRLGVPVRDGQDLPATSEGGVCGGVGSGVLAVRCRRSSRLKTSTRSPSCSLWCFPTPTCSQA